MGLKKIPKEVWDKMSPDEKRFYELEYKKAFERNRRLTIVSTRIIAIFCIFALFFIGFAQLRQVEEYGKIKNQYGNQAFCYLCGLETLKKCECQYSSMIYDYDNYMLSENYSMYLAEYNSQTCNASKVVGTQGNNYVPIISPVG